MPWDAPDDYDALHAQLADGANLLPPDYPTCLIAAEQMERVVRDGGVEVVRGPIAAWCARAGQETDAAARARYAAEAVASVD